ncbi:nuclear factor interleukin-3-regulated protein [Plakobranchus ocellatus]|uniref:Nuclear factor interleukin-3-regulated protein n=1 Tax=Plakobranchus ocellatus TaxID=259542 RepID=A0AAV4C8N8_9GAST|nr:nuclear factor interleukin-3-regulated protein [Plakobranchus ocellatus]
MHHQQQHHNQHQHQQPHLHSQQQHHHHHQLQHQQHHDHQQQQQHLQDLHLQHPDLHHHQQQQHQQHQQSQQQQQQHQFMAETAQWLADDSQDEFVPKVVHRRAKRIIPDTEKDDKYWEKRKRNNMAAKRSRENKRVLENDIRQKVTCLEENNAMLRKELALMKSRFGLAPDQNIMTPEERAQCLQEIKANMEATAARRRKESSGSGDDVSSTSPSVYPVTLHVAGGGGGGPSTAATSTSSLEEGDKRGGDESEASNSPKLEEGIGSAGGSGAIGGDAGGVGYGPSAYGPFNPSPSWGPIGAAGMNAFSGASTGTPGHAFSPALSGVVGGSTKLPPISNAFQEKSGSGGFGRFVGSVGGLGAYARPPYDYFSQYSPQMLYGPGDAIGLSGGAAPADLSTNRNKRQEETSSIRGASSGALNGNSSNRSGPTKTENLGNTMIPSPGGGNNGGMLLDDMAAMASSLAHTNAGRLSEGAQDSQMMARGLTVPTRLNTPGSSGIGAGGVAAGGVPHGLAAEAAALAASTQGIKGPEEEHLKRENDALKMAVRTLTAQMEHMKDQVYKD